MTRPTTMPIGDEREVTLGRVVCVSGSQLVALLDAGTGPEETPGLQIGNLVKLRTPRSTVYGLVNGVSVPTPTERPDGADLRIAEIDLLGEALHGEGAALETYRRGVSCFPSLGDALLTTTRQDLSHVYAPRTAATARIGTLHQDPAIPAYAMIDDLLGKHVAILGTTGSGKSCATALILHAILDQHANAHVLLLDPHNEYAAAFGARAERLAPGDLELPYWLFTFEEIVEVVLGRGASTAECAILNEAIARAKAEFAAEGEELRNVTADTPVPYRLADLVRVIDDAAGKLAKPEQAGPYMRLKTRLQALESDARYAFMFGGIVVRDNLTKILSRLLRIPVAGKPITIVDLSSVPSDILSVVVSVLCRVTFDFAVWSDGAVPITLVCEEAHRYAPRDEKLGFEPTKRAISRIAKEGRKYGVSLFLVSQRPTELAAGILSQCNTVFALRMSNQTDQEFVRGTLWEAAQALIDALPSLRNAEAIVVGEGVPVPMRLAFDQLPVERRPKSATAAFSAAWSKEGDGEEMLRQVVDRWRRQRRAAAPEKPPLRAVAGARGN